MQFLSQCDGIYAKNFHHFSSSNLWAMSPVVNVNDKKRHLALDHVRLYIRKINDTRNEVIDFFIISLKMKHQIHQFYICDAVGLCAKISASMNQICIQYCGTEINVAKHFDNSNNFIRDLLYRIEPKT